MVKSKESKSGGNLRVAMTEIDVGLKGLVDIMFDKFIDHSKEIRPAEQKLYLKRGEAGENLVVLPSENVRSFLLGEDPAGCAKMFEGVKGKGYISMGTAMITISPTEIPFTDGDRNICFTTIPDDRFRIEMSGGRTKQGARSIKQEAKPRPVMRMPWCVRFKITLWENQMINETKLENWFVMGGLRIGLGTWRPRFGRFEVVEWKVL